MKTNRIFTNIGTPYVKDQEENLEFSLPDGYLINVRSRTLWFGGSKNERYRILIRRINSSTYGFPDLYINRELDLYFEAEDGRVQLNPLVRAMKVSGKIGGEAVIGYSALIKPKKGLRYQIIISLHEEDELAASLDLLKEISNRLLASSQRNNGRYLKLG